MSRTQINGWQFFALLLPTLMSSGILLLPAYVSRYVVADAWLVGPSIVAGGLLIVAIQATLAMRFPTISPATYAEPIIGKYLGKVVGVLILFLYVISFAVSCRILSEFVVTAILPSTPLTVIVVVMVGLSAYATRHGPEVIARVGEVGFFVLLLGFLGVVALMAKEAHPSNLLPVLEHGLSPVIYATIGPWGYIGEMITALSFVPCLRPGVNARAVAMKAILLMGVLSLFNEGIVTATLGTNRLQSVFPFYEVVRLIHIADFVEHIDMIYVAVSVFAIFVRLAVVHYALVRGLGEWAGIGDFRPLVWPTATLLIPISIALFDNSSHMHRFLGRTFPIFTFALTVLIPLILLLVDWIRRGIRLT